MNQIKSAMVYDGTWGINLRSSIQLDQSICD